MLRPPRRHLASNNNLTCCLYCKLCTVNTLCLLYLDLGWCLSLTTNQIPEKELGGFRRSMRKCLSSLHNVALPANGTLVLALCSAVCLQCVCSTMSVTKRLLNESVVLIKTFLEFPLGINKVLLFYFRSTRYLATIPLKGLYYTPH